MTSASSNVQPALSNPLDAIREALEPVRAPRFLDLHLPYTVWGWVGVVVSSVVIAVLPHPLVIYIAGALMAYCLPTGIELAIANIRE